MDDFEKKYFSLQQTAIINLLFLIFIICINRKTKELSPDILAADNPFEYIIFNSKIIFWCGIGMYNLIRLNVWLKENSKLYNLKNYIITMLILALAIKLAAY